MSKHAATTNWFRGLLDNGVALLIIITFFVGMVAAGAWYLDTRIASRQTSPGDVPPRSYQSPDFADYDPGETTVANLRFKHLVYVPVYSHVFFDGGRPYPLESLLSIRNVSVNQAIYLDQVKYFDTEGKLASTKLDRLIKLAPLQTIQFLVERKDSSGGAGANFLVRWMSDDAEVDEPLIETMMVGTAGTQGISFSREGVEITQQEQPPMQ